MPRLSTLSMPMAGRITGLQRRILAKTNTMLRPPGEAKKK